MLIYPTKPKSPFTGNTGSVAVRDARFFNQLQWEQPMLLGAGRLFRLRQPFIDPSHSKAIFLEQLTLSKR